MKNQQRLENHRRFWSNQTLEELCPYVDKCVVEPSTTEICLNDYEYCKIYQELIKYKEGFLRK